MLALGDTVKSAERVEGLARTLLKLLDGIGRLMRAMGVCTTLWASRREEPTVDRMFMQSAMFVGL